MDINKIKESGFLLNSEEYANVNNVAFLSLRNALHNYFSTYSSVKYQLGKIQRNTGSLMDPDEEKVFYNSRYIDNACSAITSFHHFVELIIKDILFREHPLLALEAEDKHDIFYDLLFQKEIDEKAYENLKQIEFSKAFKRLKTLIKSGKIDPQKYHFIVDSKYDNFLNGLSFLRNRIIHRGVFVLEYTALDALFGMYALPFLLELIGLEEYGKNHWWRYRSLAIELDPIDEIINAYRENSTNMGKIALLKELGKAAYSNPLQYSSKHETEFFNFFDREIVEKAELISKHITRNGDSETQCPVCDTNALVLYQDSADIFDDSGEEIGCETFIFKVECQCCSLELNGEVGDIKKMGLQLPDYWRL
jgi:hypothetical protein